MTCSGGGSGGGKDSGGGKGSGSGSGSGSDASVPVGVPASAWEMRWTVQVVESGVWKDKYYGGFNTSMVFNYGRTSGAYSLSWWENLWQFPMGAADGAWSGSGVSGMSGVSG